MTHPSSGVEVARIDQDAASARRRSSWRLASGSFGVAVAIAVAVVVSGGSPVSPPGASGPGPRGSSSAAAGPLRRHVQDAAFAIDAGPSGAVDIIILKGSEKPYADELRRDLAESGVNARVLTNVPTCRQLASSAPSPHGSTQPHAVIDIVDHPFYRNGDLVFSVDTSADTRGTTLWIMFSCTLSTIFVERTTDSGPQPNCLTSTSAN